MARFTTRTRIARSRRCVLVAKESLSSLSHASTSSGRSSCSFRPPSLTVLLPGPQHEWAGPRRNYYLHDRTDRARAYELILREGSPSDLLDYIDGALLVDIWKELHLPDPIRRAWQPLIRKALPTRRRRRASDPERDGPPGALIRLRPSERPRHLRLEQPESDEQPGI